MKKILALLLITAALTLSACSDNGNSSTDTSATTTANEGVSDVKPADITSAILNKIHMASAVEKTKDDIPNFYSDIDTDTVTAASFYVCGSGAYPDEIAVIELKDADSAEAAKEALQAHLDSQIETYENYTPDEMYKLDDACLYTKGNYAVFIACEDNEAAKDIVDSMI